MWRAFFDGSIDDPYGLYDISGGKDLCEILFWFGECPEFGEGFSFPFVFIKPIRKRSYDLHLSEDGLTQQVESIVLFKNSAEKNLKTCGRGRVLDFLRVGRYALKRFPKIAEEVVCPLDDAIARTGSDIREIIDYGGGQITDEGKALTFQEKAIMCFCEQYDGAVCNSNLSYSEIGALSDFTSGLRKTLR